MRIFVVFAAGILVHAAGLAIITVAKIGFLVTARGGSGIVIAKLPDGSKSGIDMSSMKLVILPNDW